MSKPLLCVTVTGATTAELRQRRDAVEDAELLELGAQSDRQSGVVLIGMGPYGVVTRVLAGRFGSAWTYAGALQEIGQLSAAALLKDYHFRSVTDSTEIYGVVGHSVTHSVSP